MIDPFEIGRAYTRDAISAELGGSKRACLPTKDGVVVAACLLTSFNPEAPDVVLCGAGPRNGPMGIALAAHRGAIPFFIKEGVNRWVYRGRFAVSEVLTSGERYECYVDGSGRLVDGVSRVVLMKPA